MLIMNFIDKHDKHRDGFVTLQVLKRDIPWETYMTTKLISATGLQLLRRYDKKAESARAQLLDEVNVLSFFFSFQTVYRHLPLCY